MLKIGDFSKLTQVSVRSLRHYDKLGLLKPAFTNTETSHRYYKLDQLERLNRIVALKNLGFTLQQVSYLLEANLSSCDIRSMLKHKQLELQHLLEAKQQSLAEVEYRLQCIDHEGEMLDCDVVVKSVDSCHVYSAFQSPANGSDIADFMFGLYHALLDEGIEVSHSIGLFHGAQLNEKAGLGASSSLPFGSQQLEGAFLTNASSAVAIPYRKGFIEARILPALPKVASLIYRGPLRCRHEAILSLLSWIDRSHHLPLSPVREVYHRVVEDNTEHKSNMVEIQIPVEFIKQERFDPN